MNRAGFLRASLFSLASPWLARLGCGAAALPMPKPVADGARLVITDTPVGTYYRAGDVARLWTGDRVRVTAAGTTTLTMLPTEETS